MSQLAIALQRKGYTISGSDDVIFDPAKSNLQEVGLLPQSIGWDEKTISTDLDAIILGMHAKKDNPELIKAQQLGIKIYSYPEFVYENIKDKKRIVVAGSHGKTTTTAMVLHVLNHFNKDFDYLVGAKLEGLNTQVKIKNAPIIIIEGDEYLSSAIHPSPKIHYYHPHITSISGIAWDHINAFPTEQDYIDEFEKYIINLEKDCSLIYYSNDAVLSELSKNANPDIKKTPFTNEPYTINDGKFIVKNSNGEEIALNIIGNHNLQNLKAALLICAELDIDKDDFLNAIQSFKGASRRLQLYFEDDKKSVYYDFAHAPSKVKASCNAVKELWPDRQLTALFELHTYSSLNKDFIDNYRNTLQNADEVLIFFNAENLKIKNMEAMENATIEKAFGHPNLKVISEKEPLKQFLKNKDYNNNNLLVMTSGNLANISMDKLLSYVQQK